MKIPYRLPKITVNGVQNDNPPFMKEINYTIEIDTDADERKINIWHKQNIKIWNHHQHANKSLLSFR